ncbi:hypothetical protein L2449_25540 [Mesorhizobium muleiense]|uniref:hypothetical protein n=1 Tax=Mesorhizobium muleiense TaxID=1004279 RepID=UPI001F228775|nr:hypothetical protein [Mesorhizobium muleiense]MCF6120202.1 hypothetical protein [Mesorhizobium muleiense]
MLQSYYTLYQIGRDLEALRVFADLRKGSTYSSRRSADEADIKQFNKIILAIHRECLEYGFEHTSNLAKRIIDRANIDTSGEIASALEHLNDSLSAELQKEAVFRIPPERIDYYECDELFGPKVAAAFPSCERDIRKAGSCYAVGQEDACVHHLMLVLERGLTALANKVGVSSHRTNWQNVIDQVGAKLKGLPRGPERDFYIDVNAQFGFLKDAYRNHSEHVRDYPYDMEKALSILNHVRGFMQAIEKGGLRE